MFKYILKRLGYMVCVFLVLSAMMYFLYNLIPGDPVKAELDVYVKNNKNLTAEQIEAQKQFITERLGLNYPLPVRYVKWLKGIVTGDFGYSNYFRKDVIDVIKAPMGNTIFINIFATIAALAITIPLGIYCAVKRGSYFDNSVQVLTIVGYSIPSYIIALVFIYIFAVKLGWFPVSGMNSPGKTLEGFAWFKDRLWYMGLPLIVMTFASLGGMTRYVRTAMIDALRMDYIRTARAKGLKEKVVIYSHAWRNALLPVITLIIGWFLGIFGGSVIIENTFGLNGIGKTLYDALMNSDYELVLALQMFYVVIALVGNLIIDLSYGLVDPRIRVNK